MGGQIKNNPMMLKFNCVSVVDNTPYKTGISLIQFLVIFN
jgi:hypothetical protein